MLILKLILTQLAQFAQLIYTTVDISWEFVLYLTIFLIKKQAILIYFMLGNDRPAYVRESVHMWFQACLFFISPKVHHGSGPCLASTSSQSSRNRWVFINSAPTSQKQTWLPPPSSGQDYFLIWYYLFHSRIDSLHKK